jgi:hypothetical protein
LGELASGVVVVIEVQGVDLEVAGCRLEAFDEGGPVIIGESRDDGRGLGR